MKYLKEEILEIKEIYLKVIYIIKSKLMKKKENIKFHIISPKIIIILFKIIY